MNSPSQPTVQQITPQDAVAKVASNDAILIDVREDNELASSGTAVGALHIPLKLMQTKADPVNAAFHVGLSADTPIIVYCAMGGRAKLAAETLLSLGYSEVYNLGGLEHWQQGGGAVVPV